MRENGAVDLGGPLRDDAQRRSVLAAFLGDLGNGPLARLEAERRVLRHVAMGFLANERHGNLAFAPQRKIECHAAQHRHDDVDDFGRNAGQLENGDRLAIDGNAEDAREDLRHAVDDGQRTEHEGVAAVLRNVVDAALQVAIGRQILFVFELTHALVDEARQIGNAVGHGCVDCETPLIDNATADLLVFVAAAGAIAALGHRNEFLQDLDFRLTVGIADQHLDGFFEIQEPQRQLHVARTDDLGPLGECRRVFVVRIEQHDMGVGILFQDGAQDQRRGARFSGAGRAQNSKVLAEQIVDIDHRCDRRVLTDASDAH